MMRSWGPTKPASFQIPLPRSVCCSLGSDEEAAMQKAYTVSETVMSQVSTNTLYQPSEHTQTQPSAPEREMIPLTVARTDRVAEPRPGSHSNKTDEPVGHLNENGGSYCNGHRSQSFDAVLQVRNDASLQEPGTTTITVATLHTQHTRPRTHNNNTK